MKLKKDEKKFWSDSIKERVNDKEQRKKGDEEVALI